MASVVFPASTATSITFYSPDRFADFHLRRITYTKTGTVLNRSVTVSLEVSSAVTGAAVWTFPGATTTGPVLTGLTNASLFSYRDELNAPTTNALVLRAVVLDLVIDQSPNTPPGPQTYHTQVDLRVTNNA
jgi:hypothetical protein